MKADELKVTDVLKVSQRFIVPLYQRQYQWHDHKNYGGRTSAFWLDVVAKATEVLEDQSRFDHYMGALLLAPDADDSHRFGVTPITQVVDGQQRLTTFLILLSAMREVAREYDHQDLAQEIEEYLFNRPGRADTDPLARFKLTPTPVDREVFLDIVGDPYDEVRDKYVPRYYRGGRVPQNTKFRALRAYEYFIAQVKDFVATETSDDTEVDIDQESESEKDTRDVGDESQPRLRALLEALVYRLKFIVITLERDDDAQVIFETLNSAGQPLLAMDLVRNNIFHRAEAQNRGKADAQKRTEALYREVWEPFDDGWWRDNAPNARPSRPRIDHFLANVLTAETGERITVRELYAEYRAWATPEQRPRFEKVEDELAVLQRHVPAYETLEDRHTEPFYELLEIAPAEPPQGYEAIAWFGRRMKVWQITTVYPIAFQIASANIDSDTRWRIVKLLDSCLARRLLCDLTPKNLNQVFPRLAAALIRDGVSVKTVGDFFRRYGEAAISRFPDDNELRVGILEKRAYGRIPSSMLSSLLWSLELESRTGRTEDTRRPANTQIEHIMPQTWQTNWLLNGERVAAGDTEVPGYWQREAAIHTLGNLTIVASRLNPDLSNAAFEDKAPKLVEHSNLTLNRRIAEYEKWDEDTIRLRGEVLADLATKVWPNLDSY